MAKHTRKFYRLSNLCHASRIRHVQPISFLQCAWLRMFVKSVEALLATYLEEQVSEENCISNSPPNSRTTQLDTERICDLYSGSAGFESRPGKNKVKVDFLRIMMAYGELLRPHNSQRKKSLVPIEQEVDQVWTFLRRGKPMSPAKN